MCRFDFHLLHYYLFGQQYKNVHEVPLVLNKIKSIPQSYITLPYACPLKIEDVKNWESLLLALISHHYYFFFNQIISILCASLKLDSRIPFMIDVTNMLLSVNGFICGKIHQEGVLFILQNYDKCNHTFLCILCILCILFAYQKV